MFDTNSFQSSSFAFLNSFSQLYIRANKNNRKKTLRCFPQCSAEGHNAGGFCGTSIKLQLRSADAQNEYWAKLTLKEDTPNMSVNSIVSKQTLLQNAQSKKDHSGEWIEGSLTNEDGGLFAVEFNRFLYGWYYMWRSHKNSTLAKHVFRVFVLKKVDKDKMRIVNIIDSPSFRITSRCKPKNEAEETDNPSIPENVDISESAIQPQTTLKRLRSNGSTSSWLGNKFFKIINWFTDGDSFRKEPTLPEHRENRTLDRLYMYFTNTNENAIEECIRDQINLRNVYATNTEGMVDSSRTLHMLRQSSEAFLVLCQEISPIESFTQRWQSHGEQFRAQSKIDMSETQFEWTPEREDETFDLTSNLMCEKSLYAEYRHACRCTVKHALEMAGYSWQVFYEPMRIASENGLFHGDPFHPPTTSYANILMFQSKQMSQLQPNESQYSAGASTFTNSASHAAFGHDLLCFRRSETIRLMNDRYRTEARSKTLSEEQIMDFLDPRDDFSGFWFDSSMVSTSSSTWMPRQPGVLYHLYGSFLSKIWRLVFARLEVEVSKSALHARGRPMYFVTGEIHWLLDGQVHELVAGHPVAQIRSYMLESTKGRYVGYWKDTPNSPIAKKVTQVASDHGLCVGEDFVSRFFPEIYQRYPSKLYQYLYMTTLEYELRQDVIHVNIADFLIPVDKPRNFEFTKEHMEHLYDTKKYTSKVSSWALVRTTVDENVDLIS